MTLPDRDRARRARGRCGAGCGVPGDKSISHRALLFAALADGRSTIVHLATGADVRADPRRARTARRPSGERRRHGHGRVGAGVDGLREPDGVLDCGNSGTTMRLLAGLLAGRPFLSVLDRRRVAAAAADGAASCEPLRAMGADDRRPRRRHARAARDPRRRAARAAATSSPVAERAGEVARSCSPGCRPTATTEIVEPAPSRDHTERMLAALGAPVDGRRAHGARASPVRREPFELDVPGDPSSAAFFAVAAAITPGSDLVLEDVALNPTRIGFVDVLRADGRRHRASHATGDALGEPVGDLARARIRRCTGDDDRRRRDPDRPRRDPALAIAAAFADGVTEIRDAAELAVKESNRIGTLNRSSPSWASVSRRAPTGSSIRGGQAARRAAQEPRRPPHRDGGRRRRQCARRRVDGARLAHRRRRRIPSSPTTSPGSSATGT